MRLLPLLALLACRVKDLPDTSQPTDDSTPVFVDEDGDGYAAEEDCDDTNPALNPGAVEVCDSLDNNCDGQADEGLGSTWYTDADADGYGADAVVACIQPEGSAALGGDCDDEDPAYNPGATETDCTDPNDYNCDGSVGYADGDGDGFAACAECDDGDPSVSPGATEVCDDRDNNCDGAVDEGLRTTWYADSDGDGYGDADYSTTACTQPEGYTASDTDCDDADASIHPDATEICDNLDNDCDSLIDADDEGLDLGSGSAWYTDADGDGYGDATTLALACEAPAGTVSDSSDCDDSDPAISPAASEVCDSVDNDCDSAVDDADGSLDTTTASTWYTDTDGDGYGDPSGAVLACTLPVGASAVGGDCDDADASASPAGTETCDTVDNDCDGSADEDLVTYTTSTTSPSGSCSGGSNWSVTIEACGCSAVTLSGAFSDYSDGSSGQVVSSSVSSSSASATWDDCASGCDCDLDISNTVGWSVSRTAGQVTITVTNSITGYDAGNSLGAGYSITSNGSALLSTGSSSTAYTYTCSY